jgi:hypothetical protein
MFLTGLSGHLKPAVRIRGWNDGKTRSLREAARLAHALADDEALPLAKTIAQDGHGADADGWYAESILNTCPVYGARAGAALPERIEARGGLHLTDGAENLGRDGEAEPAWRDLHVKREDFARYIDWLRSVW